MFGPLPNTDPITIPPTYKNAVPTSKAWQCDVQSWMEKALQENTITVEDVKKDCTVSAWMIEAPWAHGAWHSYCIILVHLRDVGLPTKMYLKGATHEFWLYALDPAGNREEWIRRGPTPKCQWLTPSNYADQFIAESDVAAANRIEDAVKAIVKGNLSPDTDFQQSWIDLFGGHMMKDNPLALSDLIG